jgi:CBS domain-containing protein
LRACRDVLADHTRWDRLARVSPGEKAIRVMTDFEQANMVTLSRDASLDHALTHMKHAGVRSAFVADDNGRIVGLLTGYDIMSDRPMQMLIARDCHNRGCRWSDLKAGDIMHTVEHWVVADLRDVESTSVAGVADAFKRTGLTHIPVVEAAPDGRDLLRGLFSAAEVARRLGSWSPDHPTSVSFAQLDLQHAAGA